MVMVAELFRTNLPMVETRTHKASSSSSTGFSISVRRRWITACITRTPNICLMNSSPMNCIKPMNSILRSSTASAVTIAWNRFTMTFRLAWTMAPGIEHRISVCMCHSYLVCASFEASLCLLGTYCHHLAPARCLFQTSFER